MSFSTTISAILRGKWLIDKQWADAHMHLITKMISGNPVDWGMGIEKMSEEDARAAVPKRIKLMSSGDEVFIARPHMSADRFPYNSIVMVDMIGPVLKYGDYCSYGSVEQSNLISKLATSKNIAGIILNIDSPGGQADGTAMLANTIRKAVSLKPVLGIVQDGIAASAAAWILSACQECYVTEDTDSVGSIGAYTTLYDMKTYMQSLGVPVHEIYAPQSVDKNKGYRDAMTGDYSLIQDELKFLVEDFKNDVTAFRGQRLKTGKEDPFTGKMYHAKDATKIGLIDGIKSLDQVVKRTKNLIDLRTQNNKS